MFWVGDKLNIFDKFSRKELENILHKNNTWYDVAKELGVYDKHNKMVPLLIKKLDELCIDYSFLDEAPIRKKEGHSRNKYTKFTDEEIFKQNNNVSISTVRRAFSRHIEIPYECSICHIPAVWNGKPLVLTMDHIDGNTDNNEFSNLRWICPNCDRQLPTYGGRNKITKKKRPLIDLQERKSGKNICPNCGKEKEARAKLCIECARIANRKVERPSREILKSDIRNFSMLFLSKKYGVSDNSIRKWCKQYNLPFQSLKIKNFSDEDWEKI